MMILRGLQTSDSAMPGHYFLRPRILSGTVGALLYCELRLQNLLLGVSSLLAIVNPVSLAFFLARRMWTGGGDRFPF